MSKRHPNKQARKRAARAQRIATGAEREIIDVIGVEVRDETKESPPERVPTMKHILPDD